MAEVIDINDHQGYVCRCGSVSWVLLRSGKIECHKCGDILNNSEWREIIDRSEATWCIAQTYTVERMEEIMVAYCNLNPGCGLGEIVADIRLMLTTEHRAPKP